MMRIALLLLAVTGAAHAQDVCDWNKPGTNRYTGEVPAAVEHYTDIPPDVRARLRWRMSNLKYDEVVVIRRDAIEGGAEYAPEIRDMHFGSRTRTCSKVNRDKWHPMAVEMGLVYCESSHCILVPTVCGNVARITRIEKPAPVELAEREIPIPEEEQVHTVPEPGTLALVVLALMALIVRKETRNV